MRDDVTAAAGVQLGQAVGRDAATTSREELHAELASELRSRYPGWASAAITGSYAFGRPYNDDIDITAFDAAIPLGQESYARFQLGERKIDIVIRNPGWIDPAVAARGDVLFMLRELRKLVSAIVLFDNGLLGQAIPWWREFQIPVALVAPFYERVNRVELETLDGSARRFALYYALENMVIGWTHTEMHYRYSKPKWLAWDLDQLGSEAFSTLMRGVAAELCHGADIDELATRLDVVVPESRRSRSRKPQGGEVLDDIDFAKKMLDDVTFLTERGEHMAAVWPLRMACFQLAKWKAGELGFAYRDIRSIPGLLAELGRSDEAAQGALGDAFLAERPVPAELVELFGTARRDFQACLARRTAHATRR